jgi:hypothetical protein
MIGHVVDAKVKRFIHSKRKTALITKDFLGDLDAEVCRVVTLSAEEIAPKIAVCQLMCGKDTPFVVPKTKKQLDRLVCDVRIKETIRKILGKNATGTKHFLADVNTYVAAMITASLGHSANSGAYIKSLVTGRCVKELPEEPTKSDSPSVNTSPLSSSPNPISHTDSLRKIPAAKPRGDRRLDYEATITLMNKSILAIAGGFTAFTALDESRMTAFLEGRIRQTFENIGIRVDTVVFTKLTYK